MLLEKIRTAADQIWPSVDTPHQEVLHSEVNGLGESVKNCLTSASDRQEQLEKDLQAFRDYERLLEEVNQFIVIKSQITDETATNIPALKMLIANLESRMAFFQVHFMQQIAYNCCLLLMLPYSFG